MKNALWAVLGLFVCAVWSTAETIDSVSFNPARLGRYETLKVSNELNALGGVETQAVTVQSGGAVRVNNAGSYRFAETEVEGGVEMKNTEFVANALQSHGTASFESALGKESWVGKLTHNGDVDVRANILDMKKVEVMAPGTSGSWRLGENLIPSPESVGLSNCKDLDWYKRVDDRNYEWQVLAFGSCDGDCATHYGSWMMAGLMTTDTCDGDKNTEFSCSNAPRGKKTTCVDVYSGNNSSSSSSSHVSTAYMSAVPAENTDKDQCDGNNEEGFICSEEDAGTSCLDVYLQGSGFLLDGQFMPTNIVCHSSCKVKEESYLNGSYAAKEEILDNGIDSFCSNLMAQNPGKDECSGCVLWDTANTGGTHRAFECTAERYKRTAICSANTVASPVQYRNVTCCGNE